MKMKMQIQISRVFLYRYRVNLDQTFTWFVVVQCLTTQGTPLSFVGPQLIVTLMTKWF